MAEPDQQAQNRMDASVLPFGMTWDRPVFKRVRSIAMALFGAYEVTVTIVRDGRVWRSVDPENKLPQRDRAGQIVIDGGVPRWFSDLTLIPELADGVMVVGPPHLRYYIGAPIILSDGLVLGALCVVGTEVRPEEPRMLARLCDLAALIAEECNAARAAQEKTQDAAQLKSANNLVAAVVGAVPVSLMMVDTEMRVVVASKTWLRQMDLTAEEAIGRVVYDIMPSYEIYREGYNRVLAGETIRSERVRWPLRDGSVSWLRTELTPWLDDDGNVRGLISAALDITDTVDALRRSERSEQRMNLAAQMANLHVWELDYENQTLVLGGLMEATQEELFGRRLTYNELVSNIYGTIHGSQREAIKVEWDKAVMEGRHFIPEYRVARDDDKEVWAACSVNLVRDRQGKPRGLIGVMQNITDRKQAEIALMHAKDDAEAANRAKSAFLATMSHEIRTPLNGVLGMAQAMAAEDLSDTQRERLSIIRQSGETLLAILNDVLDISKIEAGKLELENAEFDIAEVAQGAHAAFTELAHCKGLSFNLMVGSSAQGVYMGDSTRLRQILYNLVSNAVKFTEEGEVRVTVERSDGAIRLRVTDTGVGVPADRLEKLFEKFEQADASTTRRYGGTGLGLAICRDLAVLMGGKIAATSTVGAGSTFEVILPLARVADSRASADRASTEAKDRGHTSGAGQLRVLAAEDNAVNQLVLRTLLNQAGVDPVLVSDGAQALEAWRDGQWDVILMDVQMPEMDGPAATRAIRAEERATGRARTPIIALTANAMAHQVAEYRACGMDDFVAKPIEIGQLFAAMERVLGEADETREVRAS